MSQVYLKGRLPPLLLLLLLLSAGIKAGAARLP
jgi:hypothetical protein